MRSAGSQHGRSVLLRGLTYARLALSLLAIVLVIVATARHPSGRLAPAAFVSILLISMVILSVLRIRLDRQRSTSTAEH